MRRLTVLAVSFICIACGLLTSPEDGPPDFAGTALALIETRSGYYNFNLLMERTTGDSAIVWIGDRTRVYETKPGGGLRSTDPEAITPAAWVDVWTTGAEYRSLPPQYQGTQVVIR